MRSVFFYQYDGVRIGIAEIGGALTEVFFENHVPAGFARSESREAETPLIREAAAQIGRYLAGGLREFDLPLDLRGTEFQKDVWRALLAIPYGETASYGGIAAAIGRPKAVRAVGLANNRNPVSIIVPCHRVVGHDGSLVGYGGGLPLKRRLLELEGNH